MRDQKVGEEFVAKVDRRGTVHKGIRKGARRFTPRTGALVHGPGEGTASSITLHSCYEPTYLRSRPRDDLSTRKHPVGLC